MRDEEGGEIHICTLEYRSIEMLLGCERFGVDADAWSLGVLLLDMVGMHFKRPQRSNGTQEMTAIIFAQLGTPAAAALLEVLPCFRAAAREEGMACERLANARL